MNLLAKDISDKKWNRTRLIITLVLYSLIQNLCTPYLITSYQPTDTGYGYSSKNLDKKGKTLTLPVYYYPKQQPGESLYEDDQQIIEKQDKKKQFDRNVSGKKGKTLTLPVYYYPKQDDYDEQYIIKSNYSKKKQNNQLDPIIRNSILSLYRQQKKKQEKAQMKKTKYQIIKNQKEIIKQLTINFLRKLSQKNKKVPKYDQYLQIYNPGINLGSEEDLYRRLIYWQNVQMINKHNSNPLNKYKIGLNAFTDYSQQQFNKIYNRMLNLPNTIVQSIKYNNLTSPRKQKIDWRCIPLNTVSQGACSSSYIISTLSTIQLTRKIYNQQASYLSVMEVLQCGQQERNVNGCKGGYYNGVYDYAKKYGIGQDRDYHYDFDAWLFGIDNQCQNKRIKSNKYVRNKIFIRNAIKVKRGDCAEIVNQLEFRSLTVAIASLGLQYYQSGVFNTKSTRINHGVTLVGYDPDKGYIIKNTYGSKWGNNGYGYVDQSTGICQYAMYPILLNEDLENRVEYCS